MSDAANLDGVAIGADEEEPAVANAQPKLFSSLESFRVARAPLRKAMHRGEKMHGGWACFGRRNRFGLDRSKQSASLWSFEFHVVDFFLRDPEVS